VEVGARLEPDEVRLQCTPWYIGCDEGDDIMALRHDSIFCVDVGDGAGSSGDLFAYIFYIAQFKYIMHFNRNYAHFNSSDMQYPKKF
jgi:hypothetical protein